MRWQHPVTMVYREEGDGPRTDLLCECALALLHLEVLPNLRMSAMSDVASMDLPPFLSWK